MTKTINVKLRPIGEAPNEPVFVQVGKGFVLLKPSEINGAEWFIDPNSFTHD